MLDLLIYGGLMGVAFALGRLERSRVRRAAPAQPLSAFRRASEPLGATRAPVGPNTPRISPGRFLDPSISKEDISLFLEDPK